MTSLRAALLLLFPSVALGAGFALDTQGARASGMGAAVAAAGDDASQIFFNPAGIVGQAGRLEVQVGGTLIAPLLRVESSAYRTSSELSLSPPPHLYARYAVSAPLSVGLGLFTPFGASSRWPQGWEGRYRTTSSRLTTYVLNPAVAYRPHPRVSVGAGAQLVRGTVLLERDLNFVDSQGTATLGGGAFGVGGTAGVRVEAIPERLAFGLSWRSAVRLPFSGRAHFGNVPPELQSTLADQALTTTITLPDLVLAGVSYAVDSTLRLALDAHYTRWSTFPSLDLQFEDLALSSSLQKSWHDTVSAHLGAEYDLSAQTRLRAGLTFDPTPSPAQTLTPDLPDGNRLKLSLGGGQAFGALRADLAYQLVLILPTASTAPELPATYSGTAHVLALTVGWRSGP